MRKNIANILVVFRIILIFAVILLFDSKTLASRIAGLFLLVVAALLDGLDGYFARRYNAASLLGGMVDTLGDRITENLLLIFFAYKQLIPIFVPLVFVARSLTSDFIRYLSFRRGVGTFSINKSRLGIILVASRPSRVIYLLSKIIIFFLGGIILTANTASDILRVMIYYGSILLVIFNLLRFVLLVYDSRFVLKEEFKI